MGDQELIERYIEASPYGMADARLRDYGVHVWAIIGQLQVENGDRDAVARLYFDNDVSRLLGHLIQQQSLM